MRGRSLYLGALAVMLSLLLVAPALAQKKGKRKRPSRGAGSVGLVDTEKNYLIIVTSKGKLIEAHFDDKTKVTKLVPEKSKISAIRLRARASITYSKKGGKNMLRSIKFEGRAKRGKKGKKRR